jgi:hypothetical protein
MENTLKKARSSENKLSHSPSLRTSPSTHVHSVGSQWLNLLSLPNVYAGFCTRGNDRPGVRDADVERRAVNSEIQWRQGRIAASVRIGAVYASLFDSRSMNGKTQSGGHWNVTFLTMASGSGGLGSPTQSSKSGDGSVNGILYITGSFHKRVAQRSDRQYAEKTAREGHIRP